MKKIPTLFERDWDGDRRFVLPKVVAGCEWVTDGEGVPTRKYDGTCVMFDGERWWARREVKPAKMPPKWFQAIETDPETGKTIGWEPIEQSGYAKIHAAVLARLARPDPPLAPIIDWWPGTYELIGPKVNGNPEGILADTLVRHETAVAFETAPRDFEGLAAWLHSLPYEGIVWHHPDGRMAKIKKRDFPQP